MSTHNEGAFEQCGESDRIALGTDASLVLEAEKLDRPIDLV